MWIFMDYLSGGTAIFTTEKAAKEFKKKMDNYLIENNNSALEEDEFSIRQVEVNPNFDKWINEP